MAATTWVFTNAVPTFSTAVRKAMALSGDKRTAALAAIPSADNALSVKADAILKNGKALDGTTVNLTIAHIRDDETFSYSFDKDSRTVTIVRTEGQRGRKSNGGESAESVNDLLTALRS